MGRRRAARTLSGGPAALASAAGDKLKQDMEICPEEDPVKPLGAPAEWAKHAPLHTVAVSTSCTG